MSCIFLKNKLNSKHTSLFLKLRGSLHLTSKYEAYKTLDLKADGGYVFLDPTLGV